MRTWNCVHGYAALILAAALIMTACGDAEGGPGGGGGDPPPPPPTDVIFTINRADYLGTAAQDFIFHVVDLSADPDSVKVGATDLDYGVDYTRDDDEITVTTGLNPTTLSDITVKVGEETGTLKGMFTYNDATKIKNKYEDLLTVIHRGLGALNTAGSGAYDNNMSDIRTDVQNLLPNLSLLSEEDFITYLEGSDQMPNDNGTWPEGINLAMQTILANYATILTDGLLSDPLKVDLKERLIRIYMNKTNPANDAALKTILGADIQTAATTSLSMLPPKGRLGAPGAGLA
jgi:hypothetical protein